MSTVFLFLGVAGLLNDWVLGLTLSVALLLAAPQIRGVARALRLAVNGIWTTSKELELRWLPALGLLTMAPFLLASLLPPTDWDALMYHLRIPAEFLAAGSVFLPPDNLHFGYLGPIQFLYLPLLAVGALSAPAILSMGFAALLALAIYDLGREFVDSPTGLLAQTVVWSSSSLLLVASTPRVDTTLALFVTLCLIAFEARMTSATQRPSALLAGLLLGSAMAVKTSAVLFLPCLLAVYGWAEWRRRPDLGALLRSALLVAGGATIVLLPWGLKNGYFMGHPLGLLQMRSELDPWLANLHSSGAFPAGMPVRASRALVDARLPFDPVAFFLRPGTLTIEAEGSVYFPGLLFLALPLLVFLPVSATVLRMLITSLGFVAAVIFYRPATNLRYLIPALAGLSLASAYLLEQGSAELVRLAPARRAVLMFILVASLVPTWFAGLVRLRESALTWDYLTGQVSPATYLQDPGSPLGGYGPILEEANSKLPHGSRVLFLFEARGLYLKHQALQDNRLLNWPALTPLLDQDSCLDGAGFTHVLVNEGSLRAYVRRGVDPASLGWPRFYDFARRCLVELAHTESHTLYELRQSPQRDLSEPD